MKKKKYTTTVKKGFPYEILPIAFILAFIPFIIRAKAVKIDGPAFVNWMEPRLIADLFNYYKSIVIFIAGIACLSIFLYKYLKNNNILIKTNIYIPMIVYTVFIILSTLFCKYHDIAVWGYPRRYEGALVLLSYMVFMFFAINFVDNEKKITLLAWTLFISAFVICIIGLFDRLNHPYYTWGFVKSLIIPSQYNTSGDKMTFNIGTDVIGSVFSNPNYLGSYVALLLPIVLTMAIFSKKIYSRVFLGILAFLLLFSIIGSSSRAGLFGVALSLLILIIYLRGYIFKYWKIASSIAIILVFVGIGINSYYNGMITRPILRLYYDIHTTLTGQPNPYALPPSSIKDIKFSNNSVELTGLNEKLTITYLNNNFAFFDSNNRPLNYALQKGQFTINDPRYKDYYIHAYLGVTPDTKYILRVQNNLVLINFAFTNTGAKFADNNSIPVEPYYPETFGFKGKESFASGRGYIWSRSIPLLKNTTFVGFGPDTFAIHFPQNDYIGKIISSGNPYMFIDKPHNFYLQVYLDTGLISLIALLSIFIIYLISSFRLFWKNRLGSTETVFGFGIFLGVLSYLVSMAFNDSEVGVSPIFWILLGIGICINNRINMENRSKKVL